METLSIPSQGDIGKTLNPIAQLTRCWNNNQTSERTTIYSRFLMFCFLIFFSGATALQAQSFSISGDSTVCENEITTFTALPSGNYNYVWGAVGGNVVYSSSDTVQIQWQNPWTGMVTLIVYDSAGINILDTVSLDINIHYIPDPEIIPSNDQLCKIYRKIEGEFPDVDIVFDSSSCNQVCEGDTIRYTIGDYEATST